MIFDRFLKFYHLTIFGKTGHLRAENLKIPGIQPIYESYLCAITAKQYFKIFQDIYYPSTQRLQ